MALSGDDCYFYYYSMCSKGDGCSFRHVPQALGSEVVCTAWKQGHCFRTNCRFRHMESQKDRSGIACYWEKQPGGCTKPHCVFKHMYGHKFSVETSSTAQEVIVRGGETVTPGQRLASEGLDNVATPQVDPVVVNPFDEESDAENSTAGSPVKRLVKKSVDRKAIANPAAPVTKRAEVLQKREDEESDLNFSVKSLEEIRREKLQRAKEVLAEADDLLSSTMDKDELPVHSLDELVEDLDDAVKAQLLKPMMTRRVELSEETDQYRQVEVADSTISVGRRVVLVDEEPPTSPRKSSTQHVLSRLGRQVVESTTSDDAGAGMKPSSIQSRLGLTRTAEEPTDDSDAAPKRRAVSSVLSRLGHGGGDVHQNQKDDSSGAGRELVRSGIKSRLGNPRKATSPADETDDLGRTSDNSRTKGILGRLGIGSNTSKTERNSISNSETNKRTGILGRLGSNTQTNEKKYSLSEKDTSRRTWITKSMDDPRQEKVASKASKVTVLSKVTLPKPDSRRSARQERQIYRPPAAKSSEPATDARLRIKRRQTSPDSRLKPESKKKTLGWGMKTFSEIMQEKRLQRQQDQQGLTSDGADSDDPDDGVSRVPQSMMSNSLKHNRPSLPITFKENKTDFEPAEKKSRKFKPIVFGLGSGDSSSIGEGRGQGSRLSGSGDRSRTAELGPTLRSRSPVDSDLFDTERSTIDRREAELSPERQVQTSKSKRACSPVLVSSSTDPYFNPGKKSRLETLVISRGPVMGHKTVSSATDKVHEESRSPTATPLQPARRRSSHGESGNATGGRRTSKEGTAQETAQRPQFASRQTTEDSFLDDDLENLLNDVTESDHRGRQEDVAEDDLLLEMEELLA